jgi:L-asparaginase
VVGRCGRGIFEFAGVTDPILVLTTGGTIDKQYFDALSRYEITDTVVTKLLSIARVTHPYVVAEVLRKDSIEMTNEDRDRILEHVNRTSFSRIVITHGTDTMTRTAQALSGCEGKTIVLTGALAPARFAESDAAFNLGMAFAVAQMASPRVYIAVNGSVFHWEDVEKDRNLGCFVLRKKSR